MNETIEAVLLDRDGTIAMGDKAQFAGLERAIGEISGAPCFKLLTKENTIPHLELLGETGWVDTLEKEDAIWIRWYRAVLESLGVQNKDLSHAEVLYREYPIHSMHTLYPETLRTLMYLRKQGYKTGVISNTFASLELSIQHLGISRYFDSCTASHIIHAKKPDPAIFRSAADSLGVESNRCVFVDDMKRIADGGRDFGFTSFHLDRSLDEPNLSSWTIGNLDHLVDYLSST